MSLECSNTVSDNHYLMPITIFPQRKNN
uniref:Uncharacterized protein n=1 Tax=Anguilla anguilla TaxID=7936 RepID=A0A0E9SF48_ANGAN